MIGQVCKIRAACRGYSSIGPRVNLEAGAFWLGGWGRDRVGNLMSSLPLSGIPQVEKDQAQSIVKWCRLGISTCALCLYPLPATVLKRSIGNETANRKRLLQCLPRLPYRPLRVAALSCPGRELAHGWAGHPTLPLHY
jgi:hypothetical protein